MQLLNIFAKGLDLGTKLCTKRPFVLVAVFFLYLIGKKICKQQNIMVKTQPKYVMKLKLPPLSEQGHFLKKAV